MRITMSRRMSVSILVLATALLGSACSSDSADTTVSTPVPATDTSTTSTSTPTSTTAADGRITNLPPTVNITAPQANAQFQAVLTDSIYTIEVTFQAAVADPEGGPVSVEWVSDIDGELGSGNPIVAALTTGGLDVANHRIVATATDEDGNSTTAVLLVQVAIPSG